MDKYASMWKADTPVERQADARDLWSDLTGINHAKKDTTTRLQEMFPAAGTHNKEAGAPDFSKAVPVPEHLRGKYAKYKKKFPKAAYAHSPSTGTLYKLASKSSVIRDRLLGAATAVGATAGGMYQHNKSKKNEKGFSKRDLARMSEEAAYQKQLESGGSARSQASSKASRVKAKIDKYLDENPGQAAALGAILGGGAALAGGAGAIKRLDKIHGLDKVKKAK